MSRLSSLAATGALAVTTLVLLAGSAGASPTKALSCSASMSNSRPKDYSTTDVDVRTTRLVHVRSTAHYKTTATTHRATANNAGRASIPYDISGATPGYKVNVTVVVTSGRTTARCSTSFTPQHK